MKPSKRKHLEVTGWKVGAASELLHLSPEESMYVELKLTLSKQFQEIRLGKNLTQLQAARLLQSSQSRVAKMESGDPSVSLDLLIRSLFVLGITKKRLARMLA